MLKKTVDCIARGEGNTKQPRPHSTSTTLPPNPPGTPVSQPNPPTPVSQTTLPPNPPTVSFSMRNSSCCCCCFQLNQICTQRTAEIASTHIHILCSLVHLHQHQLDLDYTISNSTASSSSRKPFLLKWFLSWNQLLDAAFPFRTRLLLNSDIFEYSVCGHLH